MKNGLEKEENLIYEMNNILRGFVRSMALKRISLENANKQTDRQTNICTCLNTDILYMLSIRYMCMSFCILVPSDMSIYLSVLRVKCSDFCGNQLFIEVKTSPTVE